MITSLPFFIATGTTLFAAAMLLALLTGLYGYMVTWSLKTRSDTALLIGYAGYVFVFIYGSLNIHRAITSIQDWNTLSLISATGVQLVLCLIAGIAFYLYTFRAFRDLSIGMNL